MRKRWPILALFVGLIIASLTIAGGQSMVNGFLRFSDNTLSVAFPATCPTQAVCSGGGGGGSSPIPTPTNGIYPVAQSSVPWSVACAAAYPCGLPTPIPFPSAFFVTGAFPTPIAWTTASPEPVACITGCGGSSGGATSSPGPVQAPTAAAPVYGEVYWWNGTNFVAVSASSPLPVVTPAPVATMFVVNTPGVTIQNTPGFVCVSGCGSAATTPLPTASAGAPVPAAAAPAWSQTVCFYTTGTVALTNLQGYTQRCDALGYGGVDLEAWGGALVTAANPIPVTTAPPCTTATCSITVNTPAPVATVFIANTPGVSVANWTQPSPLYTTPVTTPVPYATASPAGLLAQGVCTASAPCAPAIGDTSFSVHPTVTASPYPLATLAASKSIHLTSIAVSGYQTATGGYVAIGYATANTCASMTVVGALGSQGATIAVPSTITWGTGFGSVYIFPSGDAACAEVIGGTIGIEYIFGTYATY